MAKKNKKTEIEKLTTEIGRLKMELREKKKYGLVWEDKPEDVVEQCKRELPVLKEVKNKAIAKDKNGPVNILIEGDNYHALSVLNYTHNKKIDLIYIDPPYNTGSEGFVYNDKIVNREDSYRHSKWLNFMDKRLKLAKNLLRKDGVILINIDDNEIAQLKLLCDEIFGEDYFRNTIIWSYRTGGAPHKNDAFSRKHDYILLYSRSKEYFFNRFKEKIPYEKDFFGAKKDEAGKFYADVNLRDVIEGDIILFKDGREYKKISVKPVLNLSSERVEDFPTQKPIGLIRYFLEMLSRPNGTILDFFAGSGTTGHAVLDLNRENKDRRQFILCTNNEGDICTRICYPRLKRNIVGFKKSSGKRVVGLGGNLKYFRTAFVGAEPNDKNKEALTKQATEMLCMREDTFEPVKETATVKIFKNSKQHTGIVFNEDTVPALKKDITRIGGAWSVYIFSLGDDTFEDEFEGMKQKITVAPIPEAILWVYRRLFKP